MKRSLDERRSQERIAFMRETSVSFQQPTAKRNKSMENNRTPSIWRKPRGGRDASDTTIIGRLSLIHSPTHAVAFVCCLPMSRRRQCSFSQGCQGLSGFLGRRGRSTLGINTRAGVHATSTDEEYLCPAESHSLLPRSLRLECEQQIPVAA
jgi:hypothetical protein